MTTAHHPVTGLERFFNALLGLMVSLGIGPSYCRELIVKGRKSGRLYSTPVNLLDHEGRLYLVAPRGHTQWSRNAEAAGEVELKRGASRVRYRVRPTTRDERPLLIKLYLERYASQVQRFFPVRADAPLEQFVAIVDDYPAFELLA